MDICVDDLRDERVHALLEEHLRHMRSVSPPESTHALDLDKLRSPEITFWTAWSGDELLGCAALKQLDARHGEIKSMRTASSRQRSGIGAAMLRHVIDTARQRGYTRLSLETGSMAAFRPAHRLYESHGFVDCEPFAHYRPDPNSRFMTRLL